MRIRWLLAPVVMLALLAIMGVRSDLVLGQPDQPGSDSQYLPVVMALQDGLPTPTPTGTAVTCAPTDGLLQNPGFEAGRGSWTFFTNGQGTYATTGPAYECELAAQLTLSKVAKNIQLYQSGFRLQAGSTYRLTFSAYSSSGHDLQILIHQHGAPYRDYGLNTTADLSTGWQRLSSEFVAQGFAGSTTETRLRFWFPADAQDGDVYWLDDIRLEEIGGGSTPTPPPTATVGPTNTPAPGATNTPVPQPTNTPAPQPTSTQVPGATSTPQPTPPAGRELLVFNLNRPVTEADRGFPYDQPPTANGNWITPVNYAAGTLYYRLEVRDQPVAQNMKIQFCFWQEKGGYNFELENCGPTADVRGVSGTVKTWSVKVGDMWKRNGNSIEWGRPRYRNGMAIKNAEGEPVSNYNGWNWNGEDPKKWYPLDISFKVVVVAPGAEFSGWENYVDGQQ